MSQNISACANSMQTQRHGGHFGAVPPQISCCAPPKRCVCPQSWEKYRKIVRKTWILGGKRGPVRAKTFFFFFGLHLILGGETGPVWAETFFFWSSPNFGRKNRSSLSEDLFSFWSRLPSWSRTIIVPRKQALFLVFIWVCAPPIIVFAPPVTLLWRRVWFDVRSEFDLAVWTEMTCKLGPLRYPI